MFAVACHVDCRDFTCRVLVGDSALSRTAARMLSLQQLVCLLVICCTQQCCLTSVSQSHLANGGVSSQ
jgi:hypothetical protein